MNSATLKAIVVAAILVVAYFVVYPEDLDALSPIARLLQLTQDVSSWLYAIVAVVIVCRTIERVWGRGTGQRRS